MIEAIRKDLRDQKLEQHDDTIRLVDSAPAVLMPYSRGARCRSVVGSQYFRYQQGRQVLWSAAARDRYSESIDR